ncbi:MAG: hypothetical protein D6785_04105 [Planctomycetota bacterium]|nr:MAG: hypothetical protein D6785_04105 [Planctomycetota bacterium]
MKKKYMNPYLAGVGLGLVLLLAFIIAGRGLGASGAMMRTSVALEKAAIPQHVNTNPYLAKYGGKGKNPLRNWLVFEVLGLFIGAFIAGLLGGRIKRETNHGPRFTPGKRWALAVLGGALFGFGARMARGCTSGQALTGGATLVVGSWITMMAIFAGGYMFAYFVRKQWI